MMNAGGGVGISSGGNCDSTTSAKMNFETSVSITARIGATADTHALDQTDLLLSPL
jgi:hypothetical protein